MIQKTFQFDFNDLEINVSQIESAIGYKKGESQEAIAELIDKALKEAGHICRIKAEYRIYDEMEFNETEKSLTVKNVNFNISKIIFGQIKKSDSAAIFLCTAGEEIGIMSRNAMKKKDLLSGYIYDIVGSETVESAADKMQDELQNAMSAESLKITNRFSPGYCGWNVSEQHKLFKLMPDNYCGIRLLPSSLMDPEKSVSGIIGVGNNVKRLPYKCNLCDMKDCIYRRKL